MNRKLRSLAQGVLLAAAGAGTMAHAAIAPAGSAERVVLPGNVTPERYRIDVTPDAAAGSFTGTVDIDVTVHAPTERIVLNSAELVIDTATLDTEAQAPAVTYDEAVQTASLAFDHSIGAGGHRLHLVYHGRIQENAAGLFHLDYATEAGKRRALFTQFENSDARRFVPCWDEPGRKAVFELAATVPADQVALSNMPIARSEPVSGGRKHVQFLPTPRMSSYLLFFGMGDFERVHRLVDGVDVGVVVKRGDTASAAYALDAAAQILPFYNAYFGTPFPLPKLDMIAGPGASQFFGAMENWGAIFYFERELLVDPRLSTDGDRQRVYQVIAHEMAHQWFGDLVTMQWWDGLWLNEGFASWMQEKVMDHFKPEWRAWLRVAAGVEATMNEDARDGTHPIITPIRDVLQASSAFDAITYTKGAAVIRTLESYVGEEAFEAGVRRYMHDHAYGNTVTDDLWRAIDSVTAKDGVRRPVARIAHELTLQEGVPLVRVVAQGCSDGRTTVSLVQERFLIDADDAPARTWHVRLAVAVLGGGVAKTVVSGARPQKVEVEGCGPVVLNAGHASYLRAAYTDAGLASLVAHAAELSPEDQLGLLDDTAGLAYVGKTPMAALLELLQRIPADADPVVAMALTSHLRELDRLYDGLASQERFRAFARGLLQPLRARVGWDKVPGEPDNLGVLRGDVLATLGRFGDPQVIAEARKRFQAYLDAPGSLDAATRRTVLRVIAMQADAPTWERLHAMAQGARTQVERAELYGLLGAAADAALVQRALDLSLTDEAPLTVRPMIAAQAANDHPAQATDFVVAHWERFSPLLEPTSRGRYVPRLAAHSSDRAVIARLEPFAAVNIPASAQRDLRKSIANIRYQASLRESRLPQIDAWLAHNAG